MIYCKNIRSKFSILIFLLVFGCSIIPGTVFAITNGMSAVDLLGQYDQTSFTSPVPVYTKGGANDGPNRFGFSSPQFTALDSTNDRFFVSDSTNNRVLVYTLNSDDTFPNLVPDYVLGQANFYANSAANTAVGLNAPQGLAYDATNNRLFVAESTGNRVKVYDVTAITNGESAVNVLGQADFTSLASANTAGGMSAPIGLAYDSTNSRLFVSESTGNRVKVWNVSAITDGEDAVSILGQTLFTTATAATTLAGMNVPQGIAYDSTNSRLFVAQSTANRVTVYDVTAITDGENAINVLGQALFTVATAANTAIGMNSPRGVAYDATNKVLYVSDASANRVKQFNVDPLVLISGNTGTDGPSATKVLGQALFTTTTAATTVAGLSSPRGVTYDSTNSRLYVVDTTNNRIMVWNVASITDGEDAVDAMGQYDQTSFSDPVPVYTKSGANDGVNIFGFSSPVGLAINYTSHQMFVSDTTNNRVLVYNLDSNNNFIDKIPDYVLGQPNFYSNTAAVTVSGLSTPRGLSIDETNNRLFVANSHSTSGGRITVYNLADGITNGEDAVNVLGQADFTSSVAAATQAGIRRPISLTYDSTENRLFVIDQTTNHRLLVYDVSSITNGEDAVNVLGQADFTSSGSATTQSRLATPGGVSYDSIHKRLFVSDGGNNRILVFDLSDGITNGENAVNILGNTDYTTVIPNTVSTTTTSAVFGISYDGERDMLWTSGFDNSSILVFDVATIVDGEEIAYILGAPDFVTATTCGVTQVKVCSPRNVIYDNTNDRLIVADSGNNRLLIYSPFNQISTITSSSSGAHYPGDSITINVTFTTVVTVTGTPTITLETGDTNRTASYTSGSGTSTLVFTYTVQAGDFSTDLDYTGTDALSVNGGTIVDVYGNTPTLTLPSPGASGSISYASAISVVAPAAVIVSGGGGGVGWTPQWIAATSIITTPSTDCNGTSFFSSSTGVACSNINTSPSSSDTTTKICHIVPNIPNILKLKTVHSSVLTLQQILNCKGYLLASEGPGAPGKETNIFASRTYQATRNFQKANNIKVDGIVGPETREQLNK